MVMIRNELAPQLFTKMEVTIMLPADTIEPDQDALCRIYQAAEIRDKVERFVLDQFDAYTHIPVTVKVED
jgi:hypothetical protein